MNNELLWGAVVGVAVIGGGILLAHSMKKNSQENEAEFNRKTLERIYELIIAECKTIDKAKIIELLDDCLKNKKSFQEPLPDIRKIQYIFKKETPAIIQCELAVAFKPETANQLVIRKMQHRLNWSLLPNRIREEFIRSGDSEKCFEIYEAEV